MNYSEGLTNQQKTFTVRNCLDIVSLLCVMQYAAFRFLQNTMFNFVYSDAYKTATLLSLAIAAGCRLFWIFVRERRFKGPITRKQITGIVLTGLLIFPFLYVGIRKNYKFLVYFPVVALCLYDMEPERVLRWFAVTMSILVGATVLCALSGTVQNLAHNSNGRIVCSYGIINTTDLSSYGLFIFLAAWCAIKKNDITISIFMAALALCAGICMFVLTGSRTIFLCMILTAVTVIAEAFATRNIDRKPWIRTVYRILTFSFLICCVLFILFALFYKSGNVLAIRADKLLSGRISLVIDAIEQNGIHLFGMTNKVSHGAGATIFPYWSVNGYGYIDVAYAQIIIKYGIIICLAVAIVWTRQAGMAYQSGRYKMVLAMAVIAFHAMSESRFLDINFNIMLVLPLCRMTGIEREAEDFIARNDEPEKSSRIPAIIFFVIGAVLCFLLPRALSWLRTFFFLRSWNSGTKAFYSFVFCSGSILLLLAIWKSISGILIARKKSRKIIGPAGLLAVSAILLVGGILIVNTEINQARVEQNERLKAEEVTIRMVQQAAAQPVYASESAEIYQRTFGGFTDHIFSTEELYRKPGTMITDRETEAMGITRFGGLFAQLSEWSGIYSFDSQVIEKLKQEGFTWSDFYSGERRCDLSYAAEVNGLEKDSEGRPILEGPKKSILKNQEMDQSGSYIVSFHLSLQDHTEEIDESKSPKKICTIQALGEAGEREINQRELLFEDFDANGECTTELSYWIGDTPKASYQVIAEEGIRMTVDEIKWKKTGN